jgi:hypothetical protein
VKARLDPEVEKAREVMRILASLSGLSRREIARRLKEKGEGCDVSRLLGGGLDPKLHHVLAFCRLLQLHPMEFFRMVYREPKAPSPFLKSIDLLLSHRIDAMRELP